MKSMVDYFFIVSISFVVVFLGVKSPSYNWDMIGYTASLYYVDGYRGEGLREATYSDVRSAVPENVFYSLVAGNYRETVYSDPESLEQQIPFYIIRPLYLASVKLVGAFFDSYAKGSYVASSIFGGLSVFFAGLILLRLHLRSAWLLVLVPVSGILAIAPMSTPDSIACFFSVLIFYLLTLFEQGMRVQDIKGNKVLVFIFVVFLIGILPSVRTDYVILSLLLSTVFLVSQRNLYFIAPILLSLLIYVAIGRFSGNYGYLAIFNFTLFEFTPYPENMTISMNIMDYIKAYVRGFYEMSSQFVVILIALFAYSHIRGLKEVSLSGLYDKFLNFDLYERIALISIAFIALHFLLFPAAFARNYVPFYLFLLIYYISLHAGRGSPDIIRYDGMR